jgi:hypothetical protein
MTEATAPSGSVPGINDGPPDPVMRSTVHGKHVEIGAAFERRGAWLVPALYGSLDEEVGALRTSLGFADISARGKLHLSGAVDDHVRFLTGAAVEPLHTAPLTSGGVLARIARDWGLALLKPSAERDVILGLAERDTDRALATDVTCALSGFLIAGPLLADFLARTVHEDLSGVLPGCCAAASWARIPAVLVMKELAAPAVEIYVSSDLGRYAWEVLQRLAGTPVGWRALEQWGWR